MKPLVSVTPTVPVTRTKPEELCPVGRVADSRVSHPPPRLRPTRRRVSVGGVSLAVWGDLGLPLCLLRRCSSAVWGWLVPL